MFSFEQGKNFLSRALLHALIEFYCFKSWFYNAAFSATYRHGEWGVASRRGSRRWERQGASSGRSSMGMWRQERACVANLSCSCLYGINAEEKQVGEWPAPPPLALASPPTGPLIRMCFGHRAALYGEGAYSLRHSLRLLSLAHLFLFPRR